MLQLNKWNLAFELISEAMMGISQVQAGQTYQSPTIDINVGGGEDVEVVVTVRKKILPQARPVPTPGPDVVTPPGLTLVNTQDSPL